MLLVSPRHAEYLSVDVPHPEGQRYTSFLHWMRCASCTFLDADFNGFCP